MKKTTYDFCGKEVNITMNGEGASVYATTLCNALYEAYTALKEKGHNASAQELHDMWEFWFDFSDDLDK